MSLFNSRTFTVYREAEGSYIKGKWTPGASAPFTIQGTWQPAQGNRLSILPEGKRGAVTYTLYTGTELNAIDQPDTTPDIVEVDGVKYDIVAKQSWQNGVLPHYEYLCQRILEGQS